MIITFTTFSITEDACPIEDHCFRLESHVNLMFDFRRKQAMTMVQVAIVHTISQTKEMIFKHFTQLTSKSMFLNFQFTSKIETNDKLKSTTNIANQGRKSKATNKSKPSNKSTNAKNISSNSQNRKETQKHEGGLTAATHVRKVETLQNAKHEGASARAGTFQTSNIALNVLHRFANLPFPQFVST